MLEKIKEYTQKLKKDKNVLKDYIKCFCDSDKVSETVKSDEDYKKLKNYIEKKEDY